MDMQKVYKIKKALQVPTILSIIISIPVFYDAITMIRTQGYPARMLVFACLFMILYYLFSLNNLIKKVTIRESEIVLKSLFGSTHIPTGDIKLIDGITFGTRQFITISSKKKSSWIPNSYENFQDLVLSLKSVIKEEIFAAGYTTMEENPVNRKRDIVMAWFIVFVLLFVITIRVYQGLSLN